MDIAFKPATHADVDTLVAFMRGLYAHDEIAFEEAVAHDGLTQLINDESLGRVWLIVADGAPAGYIVVTYVFSLEYHGRNALIDEFFIGAEWRGRGLGQRALAYVAEFCRAQGLDAVHLVVDHKNDAARRLYRRVGFQEQEHERYFMTRWLSKEE